MGLFERQDASGALLDLLERERGAILDGRFDVLERLTAEKERLLEIVVKSGPGAGHLDRLKRQSARNAAMLGAMQQGVQAAMQRLEALKSGHAPLQTYSANGQRAQIGGAATTVARRA